MMIDPSMMITKPRRPEAWRLKTRTVELQRPLVMGILNVTPDSFSDGGCFAGLEEALAQGSRMAEEGADIIDIGGESTRPGAGEVSAVEEWARVGETIRGLRERFPNLILSIDTFKAEVAEQALAAGVEIVNDITALSDPRMAEVVAEAGAGVILMHTRGTPATMSQQNHYGPDLAAEVASELMQRVALAQAAGIERERICLDPGFGFAKVGGQNYELLRGMEQLAAKGFPLLIGASRKSFIGEVISRDWKSDRGGDVPAAELKLAAQRLAGSLTFALAAVLRGASILRVHDVAETCDMIKVALECDLF